FKSGGGLVSRLPSGSRPCRRFRCRLVGADSSAKSQRSGDAVASVAAEVAPTRRAPSPTGSAPTGSHIAAVFAAYVVQRVADLAQRVVLHRFHQLLEHVAALAGGLLQDLEALRCKPVAGLAIKQHVVDLLAFFFF